MTTYNYNAVMPKQSTAMLLLPITQASHTKLGYSLPAPVNTPPMMCHGAGLVYRDSEATKSARGAHFT